MKKFLFATLLCFATFSVQAWDTKPKAQLADPEVTEEVSIEDTIDLDSVKAIKRAIENVNKKDSKKTVLRVLLSSPGGHAIAGFYISRLLQKEVEKGKVVVETRAEGWCASACTFILASGSKGHRTADPYTFSLIHPIQRGGMFGSSCVEYVKEPKTQDEKAGNAILDLARDIYMKATGKDKTTVEKWLTCGNEQAGQGQLLVDSGMADRLE